MHHILRFVNAAPPKPAQLHQSHAAADKAIRQLAETNTPRSMDVAGA
jgi:hypothetical protein